MRAADSCVVYIFDDAATCQAAFLDEVASGAQPVAFGAGGWKAVSITD